MPDEQAKPTEGLRRKEADGFTDIRPTAVEEFETVRRVVARPNGVLIAFRACRDGVYSDTGAVTKAVLERQCSPRARAKAVVVGLIDTMLAD